MGEPQRASDPLPSPYRHAEEPAKSFWVGWGGVCSWANPQRPCVWNTAWALHS